MHDYQRSPHSGAGNCDCGHSEASRVHPHVYTQMMGSELCVCALPAGNPVHIDAATATPRPVRSLEDVIRGVRGGPPPAQVRGYA
jgi:hypothetical protein